MKRIWIFWLFWASTAVFLAACSSRAPEAIPSPTQLPATAMATATTMAAATTTAVPTEPTTNTTNPNDLDLIGQTGRPQFLNAYASW
ncbi:MAG: hypothetical protein IPM53_33555 [Anaerolineaceae bacterium]|nr:hypothetical protein [Anaerolineaceae bacterium]